MWSWKQSVLKYIVWIELARLLHAYGSLEDDKLTQLRLSGTTWEASKSCEEIISLRHKVMGATAAVVARTAVPIPEDYALTSYLYVHIAYRHVSVNYPEAQLDWGQQLGSKPLQLARYLKFNIPAMNKSFPHLGDTCLHLSISSPSLILPL